MRIIFFGTSNFAVVLLEYLLTKNIPIVGIVTRPDRPKGRNLKIGASPVKIFIESKKINIPLLQPLKSSSLEFIQDIRSLSPTLFIVAAYGEIIKKQVLDIPCLGGINVHGSLLPKYRGAAPIQRCLMNGDTVTGATIIQMTPEMDAGDILGSVSMKIDSTMNFGFLESYLAQLASPLLLNVISKLEEGTELPISQNLEEVTFAPKILLEETQIQWNKSVFELYNLIRALSPRPSAWCWILLEGEKKRLKITKSEIVEMTSHHSPGTNLVFNAKEWIIACKEGSLRLMEVQLEGKKLLPIQDFLRGIHTKCTVS